MLLAGGGALTALAGCIPADGGLAASTPTLVAERVPDRAYREDATVAIVSERLEQWVDAAVTDGQVRVDPAGRPSPGGREQYELSVERAPAVAYGDAAISFETVAAAPADSYRTLYATPRPATGGDAVHVLSVPPLDADERDLVRRAAEAGSIALDAPLPESLRTLVAAYDYVALESDYYALRG